MNFEWCVNDRISGTILSRLPAPNDAGFHFPLSPAAVFSPFSSFLYHFYSACVKLKNSSNSLLVLIPWSQSRILRKRSVEYDGQPLKRCFCGQCCRNVHHPAEARHKSPSAELMVWERLELRSEGETEDRRRFWTVYNGPGCRGCDLTFERVPENGQLFGRCSSTTITCIRSPRTPNQPQRN